MKVLTSCQIAIHRENSVLTSCRKLEHFAISFVFAMDPFFRVSVSFFVTSPFFVMFKNVVVALVTLSAILVSMIMRGTVTFNLKHIPKNTDSRENCSRTSFGGFPKLISRPSATSSTCLPERRVIVENLIKSREIFFQ